MPQYTTGELAKLCGVSVRTVQFYDAKDLLKPSALTEGGRRLYSVEDLNRLRLICLLKKLGLTLGTIGDLLRSAHPEKILYLLLDEQAKQVNAAIKDGKKQLEAIRAVQESIRRTNSLAVNAIGDIERFVGHKKKLTKMHRIMLILGLIMDAIAIGTLYFWIVKGIWQLFAIGMPFVILIGILTVRMYYKNTAYLCAECQTKFKPRLGKFLFSNHTPKTRKLKCPACGGVGYCVEVFSEDGKDRIRDQSRMKRGSIL